MNGPEQIDQEQVDQEPSRIRVEDVTKTYKDKVVLDGLSLTVRPHEVVCLIGPSGSGKSTLLRCINLLEPIQGGRIYLDDDCITGTGWTSTSTLHKSYREWCAENGIQAKSTKALSQALKLKGFEWKRTESGRGFLDIVARK